MTENAISIVDVSPPRSGEPPEELAVLTAEQETVRELVRQARASGTALTGPGGLLKQLTKMVVEAALDEEMSEHLGYNKVPRRAGTGTPITGFSPPEGNRRWWRRPHLLARNPPSTCGPVAGIADVLVSCRAFGASRCCHVGSFVALRRISNASTCAIGSPCSSRNGMPGLTCRDARTPLR